MSYAAVAYANGVAHYETQYRRSSSSSWKSAGIIGGLHANISKLTPGASYNFRSRAIGKADQLERIAL